MREIKFRAWDNTDNKMYDYAIQWFNWPHIILLQYTWLKDKNWKEIYEGDICKIKFNIEEVADYIYLSLSNEEKSTQTKIFQVESPLFNRQDELNVDDIEIIWNIYENKDLII